MFDNGSETVTARPPRDSLTANGWRKLKSRASISLLADSTPTEGSSVEIKIGVSDSPRELAFSSTQTPDAVEKLVAAALAGDSDVLSLTDDKGRRFLVQTSKISYVEIGVADSRRVGFGVGAEVIGAKV